MQLKQISVFLENKSGRLSRVTQILKEADIDILALCVADSNEYGILRMINQQRLWKNWKKPNLQFR